MKPFITVVILCYLMLADALPSGPVELEQGNTNNNNSSLILKRIRRHHQCPIQPDPRSPHVQRRSSCPFEIQRDVNPLRIPDVIHRSHCLCESSPCSSGTTSSVGTTQQPPSRCVSLVSPIKVAYLDPQLKFVVSTEIIHVPVACVCVAQPVGRHMSNRNIVV